MKFNLSKDEKVRTANDYFLVKVVEKDPDVNEVVFEAYTYHFAKNSEGDEEPVPDTLVMKHNTMPLSDFLTAVGYLPEYGELQTMWGSYREVKTADGKWVSDSFSLCPAAEIYPVAAERMVQALKHTVRKKEKTNIEVWDLCSTTMRGAYLAMAYGRDKSKWKKVYLDSNPEKVLAKCGLSKEGMNFPDFREGLEANGNLVIVSQGFYTIKVLREDHDYGAFDVQVFDNDTGENLGIAQVSPSLVSPFKVGELYKNVLGSAGYVVRLDGPSFERKVLVFGPNCSAERVRLDWICGWSKVIKYLEIHEPESVDDAKAVGRCLIRQVLGDRDWFDVAKKIIDP